MDVTSVAAYEPAYEPMPAVAPAPAPAVEFAEAPQPKAQKQDKTETSTAQSAPLEKEFIEKTLDNINKSLSPYSRELHVSVHEKTKTIMVKVMDTKEHRVIREIPPEKILDAYARMLELTGILMDKKR